MNEEDFLPGESLENLFKEETAQEQPLIQEEPVAEATSDDGAEAPVDDAIAEQPEWPWFIRLIQERKLSK